MDLNHFEKEINKHKVDQGKMLSSLLEISVMNQSILKTLLMSQSEILAKQDPTYTEDYYLQELENTANKLKDEKMAEIINWVSIK